MADFAERLLRARQWLAPSLAEDWPCLPIVRAAGSYVYTADGRRFLDFVSGMAACNLGHGHPRVVAAARAQLEALIHGPLGVYLYDSVLRLCEELGRIMPGGLTTFFWSNGGTEAVEGALKLARYTSGRPAIVAFIGGFHGRSYGAASVTTSSVKYRRHYEPFLPSVYHIPYPYCFRCPRRPAQGCCDEPWVSLERLFTHVVAPEDVAAMIVEPILGEGGYVVPPPDFLPRLRELCSRHGIVLVFDEIQTGFGRTGEMFAAQTFGVDPDIMVLSKSIASGLPLSAVAARPELMARWPAGAHGTTFGGNPVACAAAVATLEVFREEAVLENARQRAAVAWSALADLAQRSPHIGEVRGKGLMIGIELVDPQRGGRPSGTAARAVLEGCLRRGLVLYPAGYAAHVIRFIPPLTVSEEELAAGLSILADAVGDLRHQGAGAP